MKMSSGTSLSLHPEYIFVYKLRYTESSQINSFVYRYFARMNKQLIETPNDSLIEKKTNGLLM